MAIKWMHNIQYHIELSYNIKPKEIDTANKYTLYESISIKF